MNMRRHACSFIFALLVSMLTNAFGWAFNGEVFAHGLDHEHHVLSLDPTTHLEAHQHALINDEGHLDAQPICVFMPQGNISRFSSPLLHSSPLQPVRKY